MSLKPKSEIPGTATTPSGTFARRSISATLTSSAWSPTPTSSPSTTTSGGTTRSSVWGSSVSMDPTVEPT